MLECFTPMARLVVGKVQFHSVTVGGRLVPQASPLSNGSTYASPDSFTWLLEEVMGEVHERIHSIKLSLCQGIVIINTNQVSYSYN